MDEKTTFSMRVAWQPLDTSGLRHYRLSYSSAAGDEQTVGGWRTGTTGRTGRTEVLLLTLD